MSWPKNVARLFKSRSPAFVLGLCAITLIFALGILRQTGMVFDQLRTGPTETSRTETTQIVVRLDMNPGIAAALPASDALLLPNSTDLAFQDEPIELEDGTQSILRSKLRGDVTSESRFQYKPMPDVWYDIGDTLKLHNDSNLQAMLSSNGPSARSLRVALLLPLTSKPWVEEDTSSPSTTLTSTPRMSVDKLSFWNYTFPTFVSTTLAPIIQARRSERKRSKPLIIPAVFTLVVGVDQDDPELGSLDAAKAFHHALFDRSRHLLNTTVEEVRSILSLNYITVSRPALLGYSNLGTTGASALNSGSPTRIVNRLARSMCLSLSEQQIASKWDSQIRDVKERTSMLTQIATSRLKTPVPVALGSTEPGQDSSRELYKRWRGWRGYQADVLFQINDDVLLLRRGWLEAALAALDKGSPRVPPGTASDAAYGLDAILNDPHIRRSISNAKSMNKFVSAMATPSLQKHRDEEQILTFDESIPSRLLGMVGLREPSQARIATQTIVPCVHVAMFGTYFHPYFLNWHSDDHLNALYAPPLGLAPVSIRVTDDSHVPRTLLEKLAPRTRKLIFHGEALGMYGVHLSDAATQRYVAHGESRIGLSSRVMTSRSWLASWLRARTETQGSKSITVDYLSRDVTLP